MQASFACCCKAMLPIFFVGHVRVRLDVGRPLLQVTRCLRGQPGGVTHLELFTSGQMLGTRHLVELGYVHACQPCGGWELAGGTFEIMHACAIAHSKGTDAKASLC